MNLERYVYSTNKDLFNFRFNSSGPKGIITKGVRFTPENANGVTYFNLAFGDLDETTGHINDISRSNNEDRDKILATIAVITLEFTAYFPDFIVYVKGSTLARTRLYQMQIARNHSEINLELNVYGFIDDQWELFKPSVHYEAFLVARK